MIALYPVGESVQIAVNQPVLVSGQCALHGKFLIAAERFICHISSPYTLLIHCQHCIIQSPVLSVIESIDTLEETTLPEKYCILLSEPSEGFVYCPTKCAFSSRKTRFRTASDRSDGSDGNLQPYSNKLLKRLRSSSPVYNPQPY